MSAVFDTVRNSCDNNSIPKPFDCGITTAAATHFTS